jgi:membrane fusion protein (multidrug efflux system)
VGERWRQFRRYVAVVLGLLVVIGVLGGVKFWQISSLLAFGESAKKAGPPPESVGAATAQVQSWESTLSAVGSVVGVESTIVASEMAGTVTRILFESGQRVKEGQVLVEMDARAQEAALRSAIARRDLARVSAERARNLLKAGAIPRAQLDDAEAQLKTAESEVSAQRTQVDHMHVRAPFAGRAGIRAVNVGQYLAPGTPVTSVTATGEMWVDFTLPQQQLGAIKTGTPVRISTKVAQAANQTSQTNPSKQPEQAKPPDQRDAQGGGETFDGVVTAIDPTLDATTRSVRVRATVPEPRDRLRAGMFVTVDVILPERANVVVIPATAVVYAPYGNSVFTVEDKVAGSPGMDTAPDGRKVFIARQRFVVLGQRRGDFVVVVRGLEANARIVTAGAFKLRNEAPIVLDERARVKPELAPHPENR